MTMTAVACRSRFSLAEQQRIIAWRQLAGAVAAALTMGSCGGDAVEPDHKTDDPIVTVTIAGAQNYSFATLGRTITLSATVTVSAGGTPAVSWVSSNVSVAETDPAGRVTAAGPECVPCLEGRRRLQSAVQGHAADAAEESMVAPAGKPLRLTGLREKLQRLIGKPVGHAAARIWGVVRVDHASRAATPAESSPKWCLTVTG